jgi:hypothetical protein
VVLKETLRKVKEKEQQIEIIKDAIRKSQKEVKMKDRQILKLKMRIKKYQRGMNTAYNT